MAPIGSSEMNITQSDAAGVYRLDKVLPGRYRIQAFAEGMSVYYPPASDIEALETVIVTEGTFHVGPNFTMVLLLNPQQPAQAAGAETRGKETAAIYSKLLPTVVVPEGNALYLIREKKAVSADLPQIRCTTLPRHQPFWNDVLSDLNARRDSPGNIERALTVAKPYLLADDAEVRQFSERILSGLVTGAPPPVRNPQLEGAKAIYTFSDVFFNRTQTIAVVYATTWCGITCGNGGWRVFEKSANGDWAEALANCGIWVA